MQAHTKAQEVALLVLRLVVAVVFLYAAYAKLFVWSGPVEGISGAMANLLKFLSIIEPLGALALIVGFLTRWAAGGLAVIMVGAIFVLQFTMGVGFFTNPQGVGWDYNLLVLGALIALAAFGAGRWSVDAIRKRAKEPFA